MFAIAVFGDSIVFGKGVPKKGGWVRLLQDYVHPQGYHHGVYNLGIPRETSTSLLQRFESECKARKPTAYPDDDSFTIIISIGTNDARAVGTPNSIQTSPADFKKNIKDILNIANKYADNTVFIGLLPVDEVKAKQYEGTFFTNQSIEKYNSIVKEVCKDHNVLFLNLLEEWKQHDYTKLLDDGLHPNQAGYKHMYNFLQAFLKKNKLIA